MKEGQGQSSIHKQKTILLRMANGSVAGRNKPLVILFYYNRSPVPPFLRLP